MTRKIDTDAVISRVRIQEQASNPSTPAAGFGYYYEKVDGLPYFINASGTVFALAPAPKVFISEQTSATGTITFSNVPQVYKKLTIEFMARSSKSAANEDVNISFNTDTTDANYRHTYVVGSASNSVTATGAANRQAITIPAATAPASNFGAGKIEIIQYANPGFFKVAIAHCGFNQGSTGFVVEQSATIVWANAVAINQVDIALPAGNYAAGSVFRLYGEY